MKKKEIEKDMTDVLDTLRRRVNEISSNDGIFLLKFNGIGEYIDCKINCDLSEIDEGLLETDILECLNNQKKKVSDDMVKMFMELIKKETEQKSEEEETGVTIKNVS